ncbi:MAG TPA: TMEM175 family protein [Methanomassiliicoccales archaeon]|jgi:uncharacterized membrane protein
MQKYRIEGLSDLVFGLALSIGSLAMINQTVNDYTDVLEGILGFVFGFMIIVGVWVSYTKIISEIKVETEMDFRLNLALLMLVAIEPYLLYLLGHDDPKILDFGSTAYAINIALIMLILAAMYNRRPSTEQSEETIVSNRLDRNRFISIALIFLVSALPYFWMPNAIFDMNLRFLIWVLTIVPGIANSIIRRRTPSPI